MPLGWTGVDWHVWSTLGLCSQSSRLCWYSPQHAMRSSALTRSCCMVSDFWWGSQSPGHQCTFWRGVLADPVDCTVKKRWCCFVAWHQGQACCMSLRAGWICRKWSSSSSNLLLVVWLAGKLWKHHYHACWAWRSTLSICFFPSLAIVLYHDEFCINGWLPLMYVWYQITIRIEFVGVCWCWSYWGNVEMEWVGVDQDVHLGQQYCSCADLLTADWGHGIFSTA